MTAVDDVAELVRLCIYRGLAATGRLPDRAELVATAGDAERLAGAIDELAAERHVARGCDGEIVLAHPFATRSFGFSVMSVDTLWWGGCAWDSFAIPHLVDAGEVLVATRCPGNRRPLARAVGPDGPPPGDEVAHFLVPSAGYRRRHPTTAQDYLRGVGLSGPFWGT